MRRNGHRGIMSVGELVLPSMPKGEIVEKLVWEIGCHLCQPLEIDLNLWIILESLAIWLIFMVS
jgi:hypothetical protein